MTVINPQSISGITSITTPSGAADLLTIHTNDTTERFRVDGSGNTRITSGIVTTLSVGAITGDISIDDKIIHTGDTNTAIRFPSADTIQFETSGTDRLKISSTGVISAPLSGSLCLGNQSSRVIDWAHTLQVEGTDETSSISIMRNSNDVNPPYLTFCKSRGSVVGGTTIVQNNDLIANIQFKAADGNAGESTAAQITAEVDATPGDQDMPGRLVFKTTPDGSAAAVERLRINSVGKVGINSTAPDGMLAIEHTSSAPNLTMRNHPAAGPYTNEYGLELRHAFGSVKHGALIHTQEAADSRRSLDVSDSNGIFATFTNGKVGIGTVLPQSTLQIGGGVVNSGILNIRRISTYDNSWKIFQSHYGASDYGTLFIQPTLATTPNIEITNSGGVMAARVDTDTGAISVKNGGGIYFGATADSSGTMSSELLDDYEEGSFTPTLGHSVTPTEADGTYTKVGSIVVACFSVTFPTVSNGSHVTLGSLPFTAQNGTRSGGCILRYSNNSEAFKIAWHVSANTAVINPYYSNGGAAVSYTNCSQGRFDLVAVYRSGA